MRIGIIGAGNIGSVLAVKFSRDNQVCVYSNSKNVLSSYKTDMTVYLEDNNSCYHGNIDSFTNNLKEFVDNSDYIFITFPSFLFSELSKQLIPLLRKGQHLVFVPGSGAPEIYFKEAINKGITISGLQRVHSVARIISPGELVRETGIRKSLKVASIPNSYNSEACKVISKLYDLPVEPLDNYLNITLINSNPILHTSRLYSIFSDFNTKKEYDKLPLFYEDWDDKSSKILIRMDNELFSIFKALEKYDIHVTQVKSILDHYESKDSYELTNKIKSIQAFKGLTTPHLINSNNKFIPDFSSRYFTSDFPYGLKIIIEYAKLLDVDCPTMTTVYNWFLSVSLKCKDFSFRNYCEVADTKILDLYKI